MLSEKVNVSDLKCGHESMKKDFIFKPFWDTVCQALF